jgi:hypothetical protein
MSEVTPRKSDAVSKGSLQFGSGRPIKSDSTSDLWVYSLPWVGKFFFEALNPLESITNDGANNPFQLVCGEMGTGKTNYEKHLINQQIERGGGGLVMDGKEGKESLSLWTIQRLAEVGWDPEKCFILDFFSEFGHPQVDPLYDAVGDNINWSQISNELVDATTVAGSTPDSLLDRGKSMARYVWQALLLSGDQPASSFVRFIMDKGYQRNIVKRVAKAYDYPELELFWLGQPDFKDPDKYHDAYVDRLPRDVLESARNKWDVFLSPSIRPCFSERDTKGEFAQLANFMAEGGWWIIPLSENKLKMAFRQTIAQIAQYLLKVAALKRMEAEDKPFFLVALDEYQHYKSPITHGTMLEEVGRSQNIGIHFLCQNLGKFAPADFEALAECATLTCFRCDAGSARRMVNEMFQPRGQTYKDWNRTKTNSIIDELNQYLALVMEQQRGEAMIRVNPNPQAYFLEVPYVPDPDPRFEQPFRKDVAKRWYRPRKD